MANNEIQNNKQQTSYCNLHRNFKTMKAFKDDPLNQWHKGLKRKATLMQQVVLKYFWQKLTFFSSFSNNVSKSLIKLGKASFLIWQSFIQISRFKEKLESNTSSMPSPLSFQKYTLQSSLTYMENAEGLAVWKALWS